MNPQSYRSAWRTDKGLYVAYALPKDAEDLNRIIATKGAQASGGFKRIWHMTGDYDRILTLPLLPVFHRECEYAIPVGKTATALESMRTVFEENDFKLRLPVEVRFVGEDGILLSPANDGPVCYIGASTQTNAPEVFERFEPMMKELGGRPHWGKNYTVTRGEVASMYPGTLQTFLDVRKKLDPDGVFANSLLTALLG